MSTGVLDHVPVCGPGSDGVPRNEVSEIVRQAIRLFVLLEGVAFVAAALIHFGVLFNGYEHQRAGTAESVIGTVLLLGWVSTLVHPRSTRAIGLAVQAFALLGTLVGIFTIAIGVGPRTGPDIAYHLVMVLVLVSGLAVAGRAPSRLPVTTHQGAHL
jgi:hypothetical protein